jgi:hypothetical protein
VADLTATWRVGFHVAQDSWIAHQPRIDACIRAIVQLHSLASEGADGEDGAVKALFAAFAEADTLQGTAPMPTAVR